MANVLFLVHRLPYPPNKGDKVRSYHLLKHLAARHRVHLGTFIDDPDDERYLPVVQALCAQVHVSRLNPRRAKVASLRGLINNEPLTLSYYRDASLHRWVRQLTASHGIDATLVFSSSMAQYAHSSPDQLLVDFVDVDSAKWSDYAQMHSWPLSWLYKREGLQLLAYERAVAARARHSFFATEKEADLFKAAAPESVHRVGMLSNGVDSDYFAPDGARQSPFGADELPIVFTGAMDYWPNIDAVTWFATSMLPKIRLRWPRARFHIVGRSPTSAVQMLASNSVSVTGTVPDVRPYLQHAVVVVAPLRLARGVQNKVLEAMAMARPVVAASVCVEAIDAEPDRHLLQATVEQDYVDAIDALISDPGRASAVGSAGRQRVIAGYGWEARLSELDHYLTPPTQSSAAA